MPSYLVACRATRLLHGSCCCGAPMGINLAKPAKDLNCLFCFGGGGEVLGGFEHLEKARKHNTELSALLSPKLVKGNVEMSIVCDLFGF